MFSPYYAWARRRGRGDPENHCTVNVALYGDRQNRWAMTERGAHSLSRDSGSLAIGPSSFAWDGAGLTITLDELTAPWPSRIQGTVRLRPPAVSHRQFTLDAAGRHRWRPVAPCSTVDVALEAPALRWSGPAYFDMNEGDEPLEAAFCDWNWSRAMTRDGAAVLYNVRRRAGGEQSLVLTVDRSGTVRDAEPMPEAALPRTLWRLERKTRCDAGHRPSVLKTLTDAPFYARSVIATRIAGVPVTAVHESLSLERFAMPLVQAMLPFRMPRALR